MYKEKDEEKGTNVRLDLYGMGPQSNKPYLPVTHPDIAVDPDLLKFGASVPSLSWIGSVDKAGFDLILVKYLSTLRDIPGGQDILRFLIHPTQT